MKISLCLVTVGFWILMIVQDLVFSICFFLFYLVYLYIKKIKIGWLCLWGVLTIISNVFIPSVPTTPQEGIYTVYTIKQNYCFARKGETKVVIYGLKDVVYHDEYELTNFELVHSNQNKGLFSFSSYLEEEGIVYASYPNINNKRRQGNSIQARLYKILSNRGTYLKSCFYGIQDVEANDLIHRLSLPLISVILFLEMRFKRYSSNRRICYFLTCFIGMLCGYLFVYTPSLIRLITHRIGKLFFKEWTDQWACGVFLFLILQPTKASSFAFVFPTLLIILIHLCQSGIKRTIMAKILLMGLQYIYFSEVDLIQFFLFNTMRKLSAIVFLLEFFCFFVPIPYTDIWYRMTELLPVINWKYDAGFIYAVVLLFSVICILYKANWFSWLFPICISVVFPLVLPFINPFFTVTMIDIGQGDCTLIVEPFNQSVVMIDCGQNINYDTMTNIVVPYLELYHINRIDYLVLTHDDYDHRGGLESLDEQIEILNIIDSLDEQIDVKYSFVNLLCQRNQKDENDSSIISYFSYDNMNYLWMGDASTDVEEQLISNYPNLDIDILKLGHHGSKTSSSYSFLNSIEPKLALISVGYNNRYGHPDVEVLDRLKMLGISNLKTSEVGMIKIYSFHGLCFFSTGSQMFGIIT